MFVPFLRFVFTEVFDYLYSLQQLIRIIFFRDDVMASLFLKVFEIN